MTIWIPTLEDDTPRYRAIADAIASDVAEGRLQPGDRLPTHRELAHALGVTVGTVSRGYAEAERRGLTTGEVGRGTYVRGATSLDPWPEQPTESEIVDLTLSLPVSIPEEATALAETLRQIAGDARIGELLAYHPESADCRQRAAAAKWLGRLGLNTGADDILVTAGSQHGLTVALSTLFAPGQVVLTGELTYPSIKSQARTHGVRLRGVALDDQGICPDAVERACRMEPKPAGLYLVPTLQNPTSGILSEARRRALGRIAEKHDLWIVEDDVHAFLLPDLPAPIATYAPERTLYLSSVAKCLAPGLRTGFIVAPPALRARLLTGIHTTMWMPPPLMVEVTTRWFVDGTADRLIAAKRAETERRQQLAQQILARHAHRCHPLGYQIWLELPEPWHTDEFVTQARKRSVIVIGAGAFSVSRRHVPHAVRLSIGVPSRPALERGLKVLDDILRAQAPPLY
ncbi:PLP-dependent aminotransferase family protein [Sulfidibacter corallicola]|uniref:PLP-dependent aminotransferase family protein n=1 Tax=Sulfidibacter corallicola TaxID=2818388 RepID=A0A8A4TIS3_SULCO|nr:PLP-dependent aminotransferase family protein [Sulfidibacter corallicola]QTD48751.1 PLP-dependent aminotransferase family protein [Sulfidibacter corallicola]